jgi:hypothetical protein
VHTVSPEMFGVLAGVGAGDERPPLDLGVLAGLEDPVRIGGGEVAQYEHAITVLVGSPRPGPN